MTALALAAALIAAANEHGDFEVVSEDIVGDGCYGVVLNEVPLKPDYAYDAEAYRSDGNYEMAFQLNIVVNDERAKQLIDGE